MTTFDKREDAFEKKFVHEREAEFTIQVRKVKLLAEWAAQKMQYDAKRAAQYVEELIQQQVGKKTTEEVIQHILKDFNRLGLAISEQLVHQQSVAYEKQVRQELGL